MSNRDRGQTNKKRKEKKGRGKNEGGERPHNTAVHQPPHPRA